MEKIELQVNRLGFNSTLAGAYAEQEAREVYRLFIII